MCACRHTLPASTIPSAIRVLALPIPSNRRGWGHHAALASRAALLIRHRAEMLLHWVHLAATQIRFCVATAPRLCHHRGQSVGLGALLRVTLSRWRLINRGRRAHRATLHADEGKFGRECRTTGESKGAKGVLPRERKVGAGRSAPGWGRGGEKESVLVVEWVAIGRECG